MSTDKLLLGFHLDHVSNLNELLRKVAHNNICIMSDRMTKVAVWKTSIKTIQLVCVVTTIGTHFINLVAVM